MSSGVQITLIICMTITFLACLGKFGGRRPK